MTANRTRRPTVLPYAFEAGKRLVESSEEPSKQSIDNSLERILLRAARLEEQAGKGRGKSQRVECGDRGRDRNGERELTEECASDSGDERGRDKNRAKHESDRDQCAA